MKFTKVLFPSNMWKEHIVNKNIILLVLIVFFLVGCEAHTDIPSSTGTSLDPSLTSEIHATDTPKPTLSITATNTPTPTTTATNTQTNTPTITPTKIGGSTGPILALPMLSPRGHQSYIFIYELISERELARIPISNFRETLGLPYGEALKLSPDNRMLAYVDTIDNQKGIYLYNLLTEEISLVYSQPSDPRIIKIRWSPDQNWLAIEMYNDLRRRDELWIVNLSNGAPQFIDVGDDSQWISSEVLHYQKPWVGYFEYNVLTGNSSAWPKNYSRSYLGFVVNEIYDPDTLFHYYVQRETDEPPGLHLASYKPVCTDIITVDPCRKMWFLNLSPNGDFWMVSFLESDTFSSWYDGFSDGNFFTSWVIQEELPMTADSFSVQNFLPYTWSPDGNSILGFGYQPRTRANYLERPITSIKILDLKTGTVLYDYPLLPLEYLQPLTTFNSRKPKTFDINWNPGQVDLSSKQYIPVTPTATVTIPPNVSHHQPMVDMIIDFEKTFDVDLSKINHEYWQYNNIKLSEDQSINITGKGNWDGFFSYNQTIKNNQGVLIRFKFNWDSEGIISLSRGEWDTSSYRQWGTLISSYFSPAFTRPLISYGTDHSEQANVIEELELKFNNWYHIFLGLFEDELVQIIWDPNYPENYSLAFHNFRDSEDMPFLFHTSVNSGNFFISEISFFGFNGYIDR